MQTLPSRISIIFSSVINSTLLWSASVGKTILFDLTLDLKDVFDVWTDTPSDQICKETRWNTNQRCMSFQWGGLLCLIEIEIQRSKEVAGGRFCAAAAGDVWTAFTLSILGGAPGEDQIHQAQMLRGDRAGIKWRQGVLSSKPSEFGPTLWIDQSVILTRKLGGHGVHVSGLEKPIQIHKTQVATSFLWFCC